MSVSRDIKIPDIGDFGDVEVIEILVKVGDSIKENDNLISLETDKASIDIPSTHAGIISSIHVSIGDKVSLNDVIISLEETEEKIDKRQPVNNNPKNRIKKSATHDLSLIHI